MHNDDKPIGRLLRRREVLALVGASAAAFAPGALAKTSAAADPLLETADCVAQAEQTEGPYFVDKALERSDIRLDPATGSVSAGAPLALRFVLSNVTPSGACAVLQGAQVDIWHCDATGKYSDVSDRTADTRGHQFLRGYQVSDADGVVEFTTIYPGWYRGHAAEPYAANRGQRLLNTRDMIFRGGGTQLILPVVENPRGFVATFRIAMRPSRR